MKFSLLQVLIVYIAIYCVCCTRQPIPLAETPRLDQGHQIDRPYLLLISLDGFRWDYLERFHPPHLSKFVEEGVRAETLIPVFPTKTFPNHYSIATGMYPENHGLVNNSFYDPAKEAVYRISDRSKVEDGSWYGGTPIWVQAEKQGIISASYFFVGTEADIQGIHPTYYHRFDNSVPKLNRVNQILDWLRLPADRRPHLLTLYFSDMDDIGHAVGPNSDEHLDSTLMELDGILGILFEGIEALDLDVNILITSDHGMATVPIENLLYLEKIVDESRYKTISLGSVLHLYLNPGEEKEPVFQELKKKEQHFKVYKIEDSPYFQENPTNPRLGDLLIVTDLGYYFKNSRQIGLLKSQGLPEIGHHGFDPRHKDLHGIFYANGPHFKKGLTIPAFENIHIYPLMCRLLKLPVGEEVDGNIEVLRSILKE